MYTKAAKFFRFVFPNREYRAYIRKAQRSNLFDPVFYRGNYPGLRPIFRRFPLRHYVTIGEREALRPNPDFSPIFYLHYNPDVRGSGIPPFLHYIDIGHQEGRITKELPEILIDADQEMPPLPAGAVAAAAAALRAGRAYLLSRPLGGDRRDHRRVAARRRPPGLDHRPRGGDRRADHPDHHRLPRGALLPLPQPRPRHPALRASPERRAPRRLRGGRQDPHQALAAPPGRRPLAAPPDARHPARRTAGSTTCSRASSPSPRRRSGWPTASTTARTNGGARTGSGCAGCCSGSRSASPPTISPSRPARCTG